MHTLFSESICPSYENLDGDISLSLNISIRGDPNRIQVGIRFFLTIPFFGF